jgi:hypothetical protein
MGATDWPCVDVIKLFFLFAHPSLVFAGKARTYLSSCQFDKLFYARNLWFKQNTVHRHAPMQCFQNALAYFATAVSYSRKMFMK